jgi:hypothetical protein
MRLSEDLASVTTDSEKRFMQGASAANESGPCCVYCVLSREAGRLHATDTPLLGDLEARGVG